jgi:polysaccharide biosynthesis transport protein
MAAQAAATGSSLVTRLDLPETGPYPVGPGRTVITGAGAMGGLMLGLGLVFLGTGAPIDGRREPQQLSSRGEKPRERVNESAPSASAPCRASAHEQYIAAATLQGPVATPVEGGPTNGRPAAELAAWGVGRSLPTARDMSPREGSPAAAVLGAKVVTSAAPPGPLRPRAETVAPVASSRPSPLPPGVLPAAGGGPSSAVPGVASGGLSLEQARQAARQIAR